MTEIEVVPTGTQPAQPGHIVADFMPDLIKTGTHQLCAGCGEPIAMRTLLEAVSEVGYGSNAVAIFGIGCYTVFSGGIDVEVVQALHGRAPSVATGIKRVRPQTLVLTVQGDGDMANEGLQEVLHTAARGESVTCVMLNNGVFGETGGHMTATTVIGQRTKNTLDGRDAAQHGYPISVANMIAPLPGVAYVARCAVNNAVAIDRARRSFKRALQLQSEGAGFTFLEILTMCPTGWFVDTNQGPSYLDETIAKTHIPGVLKDGPD